MPGRQSGRQTGGGRRGNPQNLVPEFAEVAHALSGIDLPQDKDGIVNFVQDKGDVDEEIINIIDQLPDGEYATMADVMAGIGKVGKSGKSRKSGKSGEEDIGGPTVH